MLSMTLSRNIKSWHRSSSLTGSMNAPTKISTDGFSKLLGVAVRDDCFPLRFLVVSRREPHIEQTFHHFQTPILRIDLAELDDTNRDIEKYPVDEFSRIASEQGLPPTWPGQKIVDDIVYNSSGNSYLPRLLSDSLVTHKTQLDIVLNIKLPKTMTPFAVLDRLFLESINEEFLKRYSALLVARISAPSKYDELYRDDAVLSTFLSTKCAHYPNSSPKLMFIIGHFSQAKCLTSHPVNAPFKVFQFVLLTCAIRLYNLSAPLRAKICWRRILLREFHQRA
ncbi:hypothetical protein M378DRAFT_529694 [Amanita muscaria Koide BX008]|uniref:Uncharacterized protein n=1 Tax=Amanita muscaria (strain Koide BX008) TaxID=946122 RepID=A0A0C2SQD4_AMAMK|nr:hypothetical protein M378DRAFT_529694 [Amanita muscaria Koide BX008]